MSAKAKLYAVQRPSDGVTRLLPRAEHASSAGPHRSARTRGGSLDMLMFLQRWAAVHAIGTKVFNPSRLFGIDLTSRAIRLQIATLRNHDGTFCPFGKRLPFQSAFLRQLTSTINILIAQGSYSANVGLANKFDQQKAMPLRRKRLTVD